MNMASNFKCTTFLLSALFCLVTDAIASDWISVDKDSNGNVQSIDLESITRNGDIAKAWTNIRFISPKNMEGEPRGLKIWSIKTLEYYNCQDRTSSSKTAIFYSDNKGEKIYKVADLKIEYQDIVPDTVGELFYETACKSKTSNSENNETSRN